MPSAKQEHERKQREAAVSQNLDPDTGAVPEQRPISSNNPDESAQKGEVRKRLEEAGDIRASNEPMDHSAYEKAGSDAQMEKAATEAHPKERLWPGAHCVIDNEGAPDDGRFVAVNRVASFKDTANALLGTSGLPDQRFAVVEEYECYSRDGRGELLFVNAYHLKPVGAANYGKNPT